MKNNHRQFEETPEKHNSLSWFHLMQKAVGSVEWMFVDMGPCESGVNNLHK